MLIAALAFNNCNNSTDPSQTTEPDQNDPDPTALTGEYFGQAPPGSTPELFSPGVISVDEYFEHGVAVFSPDKNEVFWCSNATLYPGEPGERMQRLFYMRSVNGYWSAPQIATFTENFILPAIRPVFSPDGNKLYTEYSSNFDIESDGDIYVVERTDEGWSELAPISSLINTPAAERLQCVTADGSLYFSRNIMTENEKVFVSRYVNGEFTEPEELGESYNSSGVEFKILIDPDEQFMLINGGATELTEEIFISYKKANGTWTERIRTPYISGGFLSLSPDRKYLFTMGDGIFWVSTSFIEDLKPDDLK